MIILQNTKADCFSDVLAGVVVTVDVWTAEYVNTFPVKSQP